MAHVAQNAHAGADLQAFLIFCFKSILLSAHKLILLIYGDNTYVVLLEAVSIPRMLQLVAFSVRQVVRP